MGGKRPKSKKWMEWYQFHGSNSLSVHSKNHPTKEWEELCDDLPHEVGPRISWSRRPETKVPQDKIDAFNFTDYVVFTNSGRFTMRVNEYSPDLKALLREKKQIWGAFLTAHNPHGELRDKDTNEAANARLRQHLEALGLVIFDGEGVDPKGEWAPEPSFLVLGIYMMTACKIGEQFRQDAIIWIDDDAVPELLLLR